MENRLLSKTIDGDDAIYRMHFKSLNELEMYLKSNPPVNEKVFKSQKSVFMPQDFAGEPLDESINYCHGGYEKNLDMFMKLKKEIDAVNVKYAAGRKTVASVVGSRPNVPNYIAGAPKTMYRMERVKEKKFVDIYMNVAYSGHTTEQQVRNRGILTLNLVNVLENHDFGVNLHIFEACYVEKEVLITEVVIKKPGELLNISKCYFPMCGKEFLRRVLLRVKESVPFLGLNWGISYGAVLDEARTRKYVGAGKNQIMILSPQAMGIKGMDIYDDADAFISKLNLDKEITFPKYKKMATGE